MLRLPVLYACCRIPYLLGLPAKYSRLFHPTGSLLASMIFMLQIWIIHQADGKSVLLCIKPAILYKGE